MSFTVIPLGTQYQTPGGAITQQPGQYPMFVDLNDAYNNSVGPNQPSGFNPIQPTSYTPTQPIPQKPRKTTYEPKSTGCCGKKEDKYDDEYYYEEQVVSDDKRGSGKCCGGCCKKEDDDAEDYVEYGGYQGQYPPPQQQQQQQYMRPVMTTVPTGNYAPAQFTRPAVIPLSYPQSNFRMMGRTAPQMQYSRPLAPSYNYAPSGGQIPRFVISG